MVQVVRRNMLLADWHDEDHKESLMNEKQGKWAKEMIDNIRLSCCVAGEHTADSSNNSVMQLQCVPGMFAVCVRQNHEIRPAACLNMASRIE